LADDVDVDVGTGDDDDDDDDVDADVDDDADGDVNVDDMNGDGDGDDVDVDVDDEEDDGDTSTFRRVMMYLLAVAHQLGPLKRSSGTLRPAFSCSTRCFAKGRDHLPSLCRMKGFCVQLGKGHLTLPVVEV